MDLDERGDTEKPQGVGRGKIIIQIYKVRKKSILNKRKKFKKAELKKDSFSSNIP